MQRCNSVTENKLLQQVIELLSVLCKRQLHCFHCRWYTINVLHCSFSNVSLYWCHLGQISFVKEISSQCQKYVRQITAINNHDHKMKQMIWAEFKLGTQNILRCCYLRLFVCSQRVIVRLIDTVSAVSLLLVPPSLTGSSQACVCFILYCINHQSVRRHTYKNTVCWKPSMLVCACVCLRACITSIWAPVIGTHTYQLSVSLKRQNRDRIRKFPRSAFSAQSCFALFPPLCLSLCGLFAQSSAGLINHTNGGMRWHRWEQGGFIITALGWEGESSGGGGVRGLELSKRPENTKV